MVKQIRIDGVIGQGQDEISAEMIRSQMPTKENEPIRVSIHSEGGNVFEGFAIYDMFANYSGPKTIAVESTAFSIASFIAMAFDEIEMSPNAYMMLHNPRVGTEGDDEELAKSAGMIAKLKTNMITAYANRTGKSAEEITAILKDETYINATDAVAMGFANRITEKPITGRAFARMDNLPHGVVSALLGVGFGGNEEPPKEKPMADNQPVAATVQEIKTAFPLAKSEFIVRCIEQSLPMASVATVAVKEMMAENEALIAKVAAMEEEMAKAKAMEDEEKAKAEESETEPEEAPEEEAKATARRTGVAPVARGNGSTPSASARWSEAVNACVAKCNGNKARAVTMANKQNPGLREAYLAEVNG